MEKGFLEDCLGQKMSLEAIGELAGRHPSTVSYWLKKHGLSANGAVKSAARGAIAQADLEALIGEELTLREIASRLDRSLATVRYWMRRYGLRTIRAEWRESSGSREMQRTCGRHGPSTFVREGRGYYRCARCRVEAVAKRRRVVKRTLVEEAGGCCVICGYARCQQGLQFHHLDPKSKSFNLGHRGACRSLSKSRAEAKKCILLCANCHAEVEAGLTPLPVSFRTSIDAM